VTGDGTRGVENDEGGSEVLAHVLVQAGECRSASIRVTVGKNRCDASVTPHRIRRLSGHRDRTFWSFSK